MRGIFLIACSLSLSLRPLYGLYDNHRSTTSYHPLHYSRLCSIIFRSGERRS